VSIRKLHASVGRHGLAGSNSSNLRRPIAPQSSYWNVPLTAVAISIVNMHVKLVLDPHSSPAQLTNWSPDGCAVSTIAVPPANTSMQPALPADPLQLIPAGVDVMLPLLPMVATVSVTGPFVQVLVSSGVWQKPSGLQTRSAGHGESVPHVTSQVPSCGL
jgi:hypothetical protein